MRNLRLKYGDSPLNTDAERESTSIDLTSVCLGAMSWALRSLFASRAGERHWHIWVCPRACSESGWPHHTWHALATRCPGIPLQCRVSRSCHHSHWGAAQEKTMGYPPAVLRPHISWTLPLPTDEHHSLISVCPVSAVVIHSSQGLVNWWVLSSFRSSWFLMIRFQPSAGSTSTHSGGYRLESITPFREVLRKNTGVSQVERCRPCHPALNACQITPRVPVEVCAHVHAAATFCFCSEMVHLNIRCSETHRASGWDWNSDEAEEPFRNVYAQSSIEYVSSEYITEEIFHVFVSQIPNLAGVWIPQLLLDAFAAMMWQRALFHAPP